jgi:hypothetical protein
MCFTSFKSRFHLFLSSNWPNEDAVYDLGIGKFGIGVEELQHHFPPARVFHGWLEEWETGVLKMMMSGMKQSSLENKKVDSCGEWLWWICESCLWQNSALQGQRHCHLQYNW